MIYNEKIVSVALSIYSIKDEIAREFKTESRPRSGNVFSKGPDNKYLNLYSLSGN